MDALGAITVPNSIIHSLKLFQNARILWYWQKKAENLIESSENRGLYAVGTAVNIVIEGTPVDKVYEELSRIVSVGHAMIVSITDMYEFVLSYKEWIDSLRKNHLFRYKYILTNKMDDPISFLKYVDPALEMWVRIRLCLLILRLQKIFFCTVKLFGAALALSFSIANLKDKYTSQNQFMKYDDKNAMLIYSVEMAKKNREILEKHFQTNKQTIDNFLRVVGTDVAVKIKEQALKGIKYTTSSTLTNIIQTTFAGVNYFWNNVTGSGQTSETKQMVLVSKNEIEKKTNVLYFDIVEEV